VRSIPYRTGDKSSWSKYDPSNGLFDRLESLHYAYLLHLLENFFLVIKKEKKGKTGKSSRIWRI
jgi:hypothetical protein